MPTYRGVLTAKKRCAGRCARVLPLEIYNYDEAAADGRQSYCPECKASSTRESVWLRKYGITPRLAQLCMAVQQNTCPLCGNALDFDDKPRPMGKWKCVPDHNHDTTGEVYGLVHSVCNTRNTDGPRETAARARFHNDPPMRHANGGVPLLAPMSGLGTSQLPLLYEGHV